MEMIIYPLGLAIVFILYFLYLRLDLKDLYQTIREPQEINVTFQVEDLPPSYDPLFPL